MQNSNIHKETYDTLANEYESRVESLLPITKEAIDICSLYLKPGDSILDIGCAVGIAIKCFNEREFLCSGIELSPGMVIYAKKRNPTTEIIESDFLKYKSKKKYNAVYMSAFIHLFPKSKSKKIFEKVWKLLKPNGLIFLSTTKSEIAKEGFEEKHDYGKKVMRFRKHRTEQELEKSIKKSGFIIVHKRTFIDPYKKTWMGFVAKKYYDRKK